MKNFKNLQGKLLSNILPHVLVIIAVLIAAYFGISGSIERAEADIAKYEQYKHTQDSMLNVYLSKADSMQAANFLLEEQLLKMSKEIDSLTNKQEIINEEYEKEIDNLNNASIGDHDEWIHTKLDSIRQYYGRTR